MGIIRSDYLGVDSPSTQKTRVHQTTDDTIVVQQTHDVSKTLRMNHYLQGEATLHHESEIMNHVASVDILVLKEWCRKRGITKRWWKRLFEDDGKLLRAFCNDPENKPWRTRLGDI